MSVKNGAIEVTIEFFDRIKLHPNLHFGTIILGTWVLQRTNNLAQEGATTDNLRIVAELLQSTTRFIANKQAYTDPWKKQKIEKMVLLLQGAYNARDKVGLKMNLPEGKLSDLLKALPALRNPTISQLATAGWIAVETIIDESVVREIIPQLKALGAEGIIEYPLNKVVY